MTDKINIADKLNRFDELWSPRAIARVNDYDVLIAKVRGRFVWHRHDDTDELFHVLRGRLVIEMRDRDVVLEPGEMFVVPRGVEHRPRADEETHLMLIEPAGTPNTGDPTTASPRREL